MVYLSTDQWAIKKTSKSSAYTQFSDYATANDYPQETNLEDFIEEMSALMNAVIGTSGTDITADKWLVLLRNICYRGVELMMDMEQARAEQNGRDRFIPKDYMYERDRIQLRTIGKVQKKRSLGKLVF